MNVFGLVTGPATVARLIAQQTSYQPVCCVSLAALWLGHVGGELAVVFQLCLAASAHFSKWWEEQRSCRHDEQNHRDRAGEEGLPSAADQGASQVGFCKWPKDEAQDGWSGWEAKPQHE